MLNYSLIKKLALARRKKIYNLKLGSELQALVRNINNTNINKKGMSDD